MGYIGNGFKLKIHPKLNEGWARRREEVGVDAKRVKERA
jgi:hypothetical protein